MLDTGEGAIVSGDARQFRRVFYNLIDNAVKYTPAGGRVDVTCGRDDKSVLVAVSDTGIGIPEDHLPRIFDRFYRVDPARTGDNAGAGLGLSICQAVVRGAGGTISVRSDHTTGTIFTVHFPTNPGQRTSGDDNRDHAEGEG